LGAYLAIDPLQIMGTLSIAVASSVFSASLVVGVLGETAVGIHLDEVKRAIEAAWKV
jgi:hypothetical protein